MGEAALNIEIDGKKVFAATGGRPFSAALPVVVFVHGSGCDHTVWALQTRYFSHRDKSVLAVDLPGHGRSAGPTLETIDEMADWLACVLDAVDVTEAAIVGHSMGSLIALAFAARHKERARAIALLGTAIPMAVADPLLLAAKANDHVACEMITHWGHSRSGRVGGSQIPGAWMAGAGLRLLERSAPDVLFHDLNACNDFAIDSDAIASIDCPALVITADKDVMTPPAAAKELASQIKSARVVTIADCGHMMMAEKPDQVRNALKTIS